MALIFSVFSVLTAPLNIPGVPVGVKEVIAMTLDYIGEGLGILAVYTDMPYLLSLFSLVALVDVAIFLYRTIMWVIKKIPFLGVE